MSTSTKSCRASSTDMRGLSPTIRSIPASRCPPPPGSQIPLAKSMLLWYTILLVYMWPPAVFRGPHSAPKNAPKIAQFLCNLSPLDATLLSTPLCVANKELAQYLSPLDAPLTKTRGEPPFGLLHPL